MQSIKGGTSPLIGFSSLPANVRKSLKKDSNYVWLTNCFIGDPWSEGSVSAEGLQTQSTSTQRIGVSNGFHCSDFKTVEGQVDATVGAVQQQVLASMKDWLSAWKPTNGP